MVEFEGISGANKGADPSGIILASDGNFYGTTCRGGANGYGTVYRMTPDGKATTLVEFTGDGGAVPGNYPHGDLIQAKDGNLYGTTQSGDSAKFGTIYRVTPTGQYTLLAKFEPKSNSDSIAGWVSGLIQARDGNFYGALFGGGPGRGGSVYRYSPDGKLTTLYNFSIGIESQSMSGPYGRLFEASDGNLFGTTWMGGVVVEGGGAIYRVTPDGHVGFFASLRGMTHDSTGAAPEDGLIQANDGNFYGLAPVFGRYNNGAIYKVTPDGKVSNLVNFTGFGPGRNGTSAIKQLVQGPDGALYGSTERDGPLTHFGTLFRVTLSGQLTTLVNFTGVGGPYKGNMPACQLVATTDGTFYGTTEGGGAHDQGTVFALKPTADMLAGKAFPTTAAPGASVEATPTPASAPSPVPTMTSSPASAAATDSGEHKPIVQASYNSPDNAYTIAMEDKPWLAPDQRPGFDNYNVIVLSKGGTEINEYPTWRELTGAFWSPDGKYVAANNLRSDMGCDQLWVISLPDGRVIKAPDDSLGKKWIRTGLRAVADHFPFKGDKGSGKSFTNLIATGWDGDQLKFAVERQEYYDNLQGYFDFNGQADPASFPTIASSSLSMHGDGSLTATNAHDLTMKQKLLGWWASAHHSYWFKDDGRCYAQGHGTGTSQWDFRDSVYYENGTPFDVISLTDQEFVCRTHGANPVTVRLNRVSKADAEEKY